MPAPAASSHAAPRPSRRIGLLASLAVLLLGACVLHAEVLFGGHVYHMDDAADSYYPGHIAVGRAFAAGELPTWERGTWCGWPLIVDPYNGIFYPLNVVYYALGAARGLGVAIALHVFLGGVGMLFFLRRRHLVPAAALVGALAFELSTFGVVRIRHVIFVQMMAWIPWILWAVDGWFASRRPRAAAAVALTTGLALVAGALSIGHFAALALAAYTVARCVPGHEEPARLRRFLIDLLAIGGAALLGVMVAAAQIVPTVAHLPYSPRALGSDYRFASSYAWPSLRYLVTLIAPDIFGGEDRASYHGAPNHWELCGYYVGVLPWLLTPVALLAAARRGARRTKELWVLAALVLLAIALALGDAAPVHPFFFHHLPLYAALRCPARALMMAVIAAPILGAHGAHALLAEPRTSTTRGAPRAPWRRVLPIVLVLTAGIDPLIYGRMAVSLYQKPADHPAGMERFAAVEWLLANGGPPSAGRFVNDPRGPFRLHNLGLVLGLESASGYDSVAVWRYVELLYLLKAHARYPYKVLRDDFAGIGVWDLDSRLIDLMNVRWVIAAEPPGRRFVLRYSPSLDEARRPPAGRWEPYWNAQLKVFENPAVLPRAFVVHAAEVPAGDDALAARLLSPGWDPARTALLEAPPGIALPPLAPGTPEFAQAAMVPARVLEASRHRLVIESDDARPGILIVSEVHYPGWSVTVDGAPAPLLRADWTFRGVALPPGHHRVEMRFVSRPTQLGVALSLLALAIATGLWFAGGRTRLA